PASLTLSLHDALPISVNNPTGDKAVTTTTTTTATAVFVASCRCCCGFRLRISKESLAFTVANPSWAQEEPLPTSWHRLLYAAQLVQGKVEHAARTSLHSSRFDFARAARIFGANSALVSAITLSSRSNDGNLPSA